MEIFPTTGDALVPHSCGAQEVGGLGHQVFVIELLDRAWRSAEGGRPHAIPGAGIEEQSPVDQIAGIATPDQVMVHPAGLPFAKKLVARSEERRLWGEW